MANKSFLTRYANLILIAALIVTPLACWGAVKAIRGNRNDVSDWLPKNYPETIELGWFRKHFVADQFVLISWDGANLGEAADGSQDDPRIARLKAELLAAQLPKKLINEVDDERAVFKSVTTARDILSELMSPPTSLSQRKAVARLKGSLIGPDGRQTALIATLTPNAAANLRQAVGRPIRMLIRDDVISPMFRAIFAVKLTEDEVHLGGPPVDNVAIDEEGERTLMRLAGLAGLLGIGLAYWSLRSVRMTAIVFMCGIISAALSLAAVPLTGQRMDAILMSMPALIYVLAVSGSIHIINYYRQAAAEGGIEHAAEHAIVHAWRPALLTSVTTAIGLASLLTSDIIPIAKFGGYSALGVVTMLAVLFGVLPAAMKRWPWIPPELRAKGGHGKTKKVHGDVALGGMFWTRWGNFIRRHHAAVLTACFVAIGVLCLGLPRVTTSIDLLKLFSEDARLLADYRWFEDNLGRIVPMELVVRFAPNSQREAAPAGRARGQLVDRHTFFERMKIVERIQHSIDRELGPKGQDLVGATMSVSTFAPELGGGETGLQASTYRERANEQLLAAKADFERSGYLRVEGKDAGRRAGEELWRISVRVAAFHGMDHGELVARVRQAVQPVLVAREASVQALKSLAQRRDGTPHGARVLVLRPASSDRAADDVVALLNSKNVRAQALEPVDIDSLTDEQIKTTLSRFDGVVMMDGFDHEAMSRIRLAGIPILATFEAAAVEAKDDHTVEDEIDDVDMTYTGVIPVVYKAQHALLDSLIQSTWWSFITITPLMMWVCRGMAAGAVVMVPNMLPVLVVFGGMGWLGIPVDIGSMMAASIALGVAVDDTIHFLAWYKDDLRALGDRAEAVLSSYRRSATATLQAGLINGLGLSVFATSSFTPTQRFGWLMLTILIAGIIAELIMLPAIMFGPIGHVFDLKAPKKSAAAAKAKIESMLSPLDRRRALREHEATVEV